MSSLQALYFYSYSSYNINNASHAQSHIVGLDSFRLGQAKKQEFVANTVFFITIIIEKNSSLATLYNGLKNNFMLGKATLKLYPDIKLELINFQFLERNLIKGYNHYKFSAIRI